MKKENGVTLVSLVIYVLVMTMVLALLSNIINNFYNNTTTLEVDIEEIIEFNKFNIYFLEEIKSNGNAVDSIADNYILFTSGNSFSLFNNIIYFNNIEVCRGVQSMIIKQGKDGDGIDKTIINISISFKEFNKTINYKIEEIY